MNDVGEELKAFLGCLMGRKTKDVYVKELDKVVTETKKEIGNEGMNI